MSGYVILRRVRLSPRHRPTGRTQHHHGGVPIPPPSQLVIAQLPPDQGYYLLYLDLQGRELTDTYHETLDRAMAQAQWEFSVEPGEWTVPA